MLGCSCSCRKVGRKEYAVCLFAKDHCESCESIQLTVSSSIIDQTQQKYKNKKKSKVVDVLLQSENKKLKKTERVKSYFVLF